MKIHFHPPSFRDIRLSVLIILKNYGLSTQDAIFFKIVGVHPIILKKRPTCGPKLHRPSVRPDLLGPTTPDLIVFLKKIKMNSF